MGKSHIDAVGQITFVIFVNKEMNVTRVNLFPIPIIYIILPEFHQNGGVTSTNQFKLFLSDADFLVFGINGHDIVQKLEKQLVKRFHQHGFVHCDVIYYNKYPI